MAAALRPAMQTGKGDGGVKAKTGCLICGEEDHYKRNCPQIKKQKVVAEEFVGTCHRCDKFGHKAAQCRLQFKNDGTPLSGNGQSSTRMGGTRTRSFPTAMAVSTISEPPQAAPQESIWPWDKTSL